MIGLVAALVLQAQAPAVALENEYVRVVRGSAPCAAAVGPACGDRVLVALGPVTLPGSPGRALQRGDIAVFGRGEPYRPPAGGDYVEVAFKPGHPAVAAPRERILPEKNVVLHDGLRLFIFEERLAVGETRERHSHGPRVVIQLNRTRLRQWPDGEPEIVRDIDTGRIAFNPPVVHRVTNVGDLPLRGVVIEIKPTAPARP